VRAHRPDRDRYDLPKEVHAGLVADQGRRSKGCRRSRGHWYAVAVFTPSASRFALRAATVADAAASAAVELRSWRACYRGILPDRVLDGMDLAGRVAAHRRLTGERDGLHLVATDTTHGDVVGFCHAGPARRPGPWAWEVYTIYLEHHARWHGIGRDMFERVFLWTRAQRPPSLIVWVLEANHHARRFYEAMGGRAAHTTPSAVGGHAVIEQAYVWDRVP
jgi:GNAT superfamily N-acetyltransferase